MPEDAVATVVPLGVPVPPESATVTTSASEERVLPAASWIVITGCAAKATAEIVDAVGAVVSSSCVADTRVMLPTNYAV